MGIENNNNILYKNAANYGLILGLAIIIYTLILHFAGASQNKTAGWATMAFMGVAVYMGTKTYRDKFEDGFVSYGRALGSGMLIVLFASIIQAFFTYLFYAYISPESLQEMFTLMEEELIKTGSSDQEIEMTINIMRSYTGPVSLALSTIVGSAFWGLFFSLIIAAFLKKEKSIFED